MKSARVFISYSTADQASAETIKDTLEANNIETWIYQKDLPFSEGIALRVQKEISESDHLLVILSESACKSKWVAWELGHALHLRGLRKEKHPTIIGVLCDKTPATYSIQPLTYGTDELAGPIYTFSDVRNYTLCNDYELTQLATQLKPKVTFISRTDGREGDLLRESFKCYEDLFPDPAERDDPADIENWIEEARSGMVPYKEVWAVLHMGERVVGIAYLTVYPDRHWTYWNYVGVRRLWRSNNVSTAEWFIEEIDRHLLNIDPNTRGTLFEVEPVDLPLLNEVVKRGQISGYPDTERVLANIRQLRRLHLYDRRRVPALLAANGQALPFYYQPGNYDDQRLEDEREQILMIRFPQNTPRADIRLGEVLDFMYDTVYADAYGDIPGYLARLASIRQRVERAAADGWSLGKLSFQGPISKLLYRARQEAKQEDLLNELDL